MDDSTIKRNIVRARKEKALSQEEMARQLGMDRSTYRAIENGSTRLLNNHLEEIARRLDSSVLRLVSGYDEEDYQAARRLKEESENEISRRVGELTGQMELLYSRVEALEKENEALRLDIRDKRELIDFLREKLLVMEKAR